MKTPDIIITHPENEDEFEALKAVLKALKIKFVISKSKPDEILTRDQKESIDEGLASIQSGKGISHENAMKEIKKRHPNYFK